jgi:hypothetical protein
MAAEVAWSAIYQDKCDGVLGFFTHNCLKEFLCMRMNGYAALGFPSLRSVFVNLVH